MTSANLEVVVCVDTNGNYGAGACEDSARESYETNVGSLGETDGFRIYRLSLAVALPKVIELSGVIPDTDGEVSLTIG